MSCTYLVHRKSGYSFLFRSIIPTDLQAQLGFRQFQLSLKCGIRHQAQSLALHFYNLTQKIYAAIRQGPAEKQLTLQQIKNRLRLELEQLKLADQASKQIEKATQPTSLQEQTHTGISLAELSEKYLQAKREVGFPDKTIKGYRDSHRLMLEILGNCVVDSLTHQDGRNNQETAI